MAYEHIPVLLKEVLEYIRPKKGKVYLDGTLGGGGYTFAIAEKLKGEGMVLGIDLDDMAIKNAVSIIEKKGYSNVKIVNDNFRNFQTIIEENLGEEERASIAGIVLDLGLSSAQLQDRNRGISFQLDAPLDMSFGRPVSGQSGYSTAEIVNEWSKEKIEYILREYGEEKNAWKIADEIVKTRQHSLITTTVQLIEAIERAVGPRERSKRIHFATKTFQALRIATNDELGNLAIALPAAIEALQKGGRLAVVSYHSLEDRMVKECFKNESAGCICPPKFPKCVCGHKPKIKIITKKAIVPGEEEIGRNIRSRSAKLRVAEKL